MSAAPKQDDCILSLLEYASLSMGLELLPHRRGEVLAYFGLTDDSGRAETDAWKVRLGASPSESMEHDRLRVRMRDFWARWDASTPPRWTGDRSRPPSAPSAPSNVFVVRTAERPALSALDHASLSMALELLPQRRDEVYATFGIRTARARVEAQSTLAEILVSKDTDPTSWSTQRESMRDYWRRWDAATPRAARTSAKYRARKTYEPPARFRAEAPAPIADESSEPHPSPTVLTLIDYASLSLQLERAPAHKSHEILTAFRLDREVGEREIAAWKRRLADHGDERARFHEMRDQILAGRAAEKTPPPTPPMGAFQGSPRATAPAPSIPPRSAHHPDAPISLLEYSVLCVELDVDPGRSETVYARLGLIDAAARDGVHEYWQTRFQAEPSAHREWFTMVERLRRNWKSPGKTR